MTGNEKWNIYLGQYEREIIYNKALTFSQSGRVTEWRKLLDTIINNPLSGKEADTYELYGDILATSSGKTDDTIAYYNLALEYENRNRITEKIQLLNTKQERKKEETTKTMQEEKQSQKEKEFSQEENNLLERKKEEIMKSESNRVKYLSPTTPQIQKNVIRETIDFLDTGKEIVDW